MCAGSIMQKIAQAIEREKTEPQLPNKINKGI